MSKKPAPLTSDLLVRKGDATPSSINPEDRATSSEPQTPENTAPSNARPTGGATASEEQPAPVMPEPEIVLAADAEEEETQGSRRRLAAVLGLVAVVTAGVLAINMFGTENDQSVAPVGEAESAADPEIANVAPVPPPAPPQSEGAPVPPTAPELRLEPAETPAETVAVEPAPETPAPAPIIEKAPVEVAPAPVAPPREVATITPATPEATPPTPALEHPATPPAPTAAIAQSGQYLIQLLSVRSEAAAKGAWENLQTKHSDLLGGETLNIEAADLGERGTFYRVRFGAFDAKADASSVCNELKAQGQDCLVKRVN